MPKTVTIPEAEYKRLCADQDALDFLQREADAIRVDKHPMLPTLTWAVCGYAAENMSVYWRRDRCPATYTTSTDIRFLLAKAAKEAADEQTSA